MTERVEELLDQYLDLRLGGEGVEIESFLADHPELAEAERERLRRLAVLLEGQADGTPEGTDHAPPPRDPAGDQVGPYRILRELGRGGQGAVYLAEDTRFARKVALKVLTRHGLELRDDPQGRESFARLKREAEVTSRLDHPGICVVYEMGAERNDLYIAMRYVEGDTLAKKIADARAGSEPSAKSDAPRGRPVALPGSDGAPAGPLTPPSTGRRSVERILALVEQSARALHAAHEAGVVHRDVKPGNIMVTPEGQPVLLDFGLARDLEHGTATLTASGGLLGTPAYMSPEQLSPSRGPVDRRADVYALGVTLYECLTLRRPFEAPTRELLYRLILTEQPSRAGRLNASIPRDLEVVLETAMEKEVDQRYQTALDLAEDLRRVRELEPILARPAGPLLRLRRWTQRNPGIAASIAGVFVVLVSIIVGLNFMLWRVQTEKLLAQSAAARPIDPAKALRLALDAARLVGKPDVAVNARLLEAWSDMREVQCVRAHESAVDQAELSDDGRVLATCSSDGTVRVWDGRTLTVLHELPKHNGVPVIALSRDGRRIATRSRSDPLRVWSTDTWEERSFDSPQSPRAPMFAPNSRYLANPTAGGVEILDLETRAPVMTVCPDENSSFVGSTNWSPDSLWICFAEPTGCSVWRIGDTRALYETRYPDTNGTSGDFSRDSKLVVLPSEHGVTVFDLTGEIQPTERSTRRRVRLVRFDTTESNLLLGYQDGGADLMPITENAPFVRLEVGWGVLRDARFHGAKLLLLRDLECAVVWDLESFRRVELSTSDRTSGALCRDDEPDTEFLTVHNSGALRRWSFSSLLERARIESRGPGPDAHGCDVAGDRVAIAGGAVPRTYSLSAHAFTGEFPGHTGELRCLHISPDGRWIAGGGARDPRALLWSTALSSQPEEFLLDDEVWATPFSPDGRKLAIAGAAGRIEIIDVENHSKRYELPSNGRGIRALRFSPDGERLVSVSEMEGYVRIWDLATRQELGSQPIGQGHAQNAPMSACFHPDGRRVAITSRDGVLYKWDPDDDTLEHHSLRCGSINDVECSPDGKLLALACNDGVRLVNAEDTLVIPTMRGHSSGDVLSVCFTDDGRNLVSQDRLGVVFVWPVDLQQAAVDALRNIEQIDSPQR